MIAHASEGREAQLHVRPRNVPAVRRLIQSKANVNCVVHDATPLHFALSEYTNYEGSMDVPGAQIVKMLIDSAADPS